MHALRPRHAGVVHQDVDRRETASEPLSQVAHILLPGEVRELEINPGIARVIRDRLGPPLPDLAPRSSASARSPRSRLRHTIVTWAPA